MAASMGPGISTISACTLEKVCGDHMFKTDGYSVCKGLGIGKFISSAIFTVGGHAWRLRYYPDGDMELSKDYVSVHLELLTKGVEVRALYHLTLVEQATRSSTHLTWPKLMEPAVFRTSNIFARCHSRFAKKSSLEASSYLYIPGDVLVIKCELTVIKMKEPQMLKTHMSFEFMFRLRTCWIILEVYLRQGRNQMCLSRSKMRFSLPIRSSWRCGRPFSRRSFTGR
jgi:speckle-type POZ protein